VRDCRVALDTIEATLGDAQMKPGPNVRNRTKYERYLALRQSIHSLASPAHHGDPNSASIEYHRSDALAILAMTAAVLRALAEPDTRP
jgi:hypothetical protein